MGMFDNIDFEVDCPECGERVKDFQSKDMFNTMDNLKPWEVSTFYSFCRGCRAWIEYSKDNVPHVSPPEPPNWLDDYSVKVEPPEGRHAMLSTPLMANQYKKFTKD